MPLPASASNLTALGTLRYNTYEFGPTAQVVKFQSTPEYDEAGRAVIYLTHTLTVKDRLAVLPGSTLDTIIAETRKQLMEPGGALLYQNRGGGNFEINSGPQKDVKYGPHPRDFDYRILGRGIAAEITWTVETCVPFCLDDAATRYEFAIMALNYTVEYSIDALGYTTRTIAGYVEIPATRRSVSDRTLPDHVDLYYERVIPDVPPGFRRTAHPRTISQDKRRMDFTHVDEEMPPQILPVGVTEAEATHNARASGKGFVSWQGTIRGTYTMSRTIPKARALEAFLRMAIERIKETRTLAIGSAVIPTGFDAEEDIYGRRAASFSLSYFYNVGDPNNLPQAIDVPRMVTLGLSAGNLWRPVSGTDWQLWSASLAETVFHPRGNAKLRGFTSDDVILNLCDPNPVPVNSGSELRTVPGPLQPILDAFPAPDPQTSWMRYEPDVQVFVKANTAVLKTLPLSQLSGGPVLTTVPDASQVGANINPFRIAQMSGQPFYSTPDVVQQRATPSLRVRLSGYAVRAGFFIQPPAIDNVGGVQVIPDGGRFTQKTLFNFGIPVQFASWEVWYIVPNDSGGAMPLLANPELRLNGVP